MGWTPQRNGCSRTNQSTLSKARRTLCDNRVHTKSAIAVLPLFLLLGSVLTGCGFELDKKSVLNTSGDQLISIGITGKLDYATRTRLERYFLDKNIEVKTDQASVHIDFQSVDNHERPLRYDASGNVIEFVLRIDWTVDVRFHGDEQGVTKTLRARSQYPLDGDALLATTNQRSIAVKDLRDQLADDLFKIIDIKLDNRRRVGQTNGD